MVSIPKIVRIVSAKFKTKHFLKTCAVEDLLGDYIVPLQFENAAVSTVSRPRVWNFERHLALKG